MIVTLGVVMPMRSFVRPRRSAGVKVDEPLSDSGVNVVLPGLQAR